jgi:alpha-D-ribose 1-methylphosphonate 5-triphosphate synthase subunit PhnI
LDARLQLLMEERDLVDKHLAEQKVKQAEISRTEAALQERSALVCTTLHNLQVSVPFLTA